jgi:uncharacterized protein YjbI with pentapeptide repeats
LRGADLSDAEFSEVGPGLSHANVIRAIAETVGAIPSRFGMRPLGDANLDRVQLTDATYNSSTRWPQSFDVQSSGAQVSRSASDVIPAPTDGND